MDAGIRLMAGASDVVQIGSGEEPDGHRDRVGEADHADASEATDLSQGPGLGELAGASAQGRSERR